MRLCLRPLSPPTRVTDFLAELLADGNGYPGPGPCSDEDMLIPSGDMFDAK